MSARASGLGRGFTESWDLFALHGSQRALEWTSVRWVHIRFIPMSASWAAPEPALKVLLQASKVDMGWAWPGAWSFWCCHTTTEMHSGDEGL